MRIILNKKGELLKEVDAETLRGADLRYANLSYADLRYADLRYANLSYADLRYADLRYANLSYADLRYANLSYADLSYADLSYANLSYADIIVITWAPWTTYITKGHIRIGCQSHTLTEWRDFSDDQISEMDSRALDFWKLNKEFIINLCERFVEADKSETN